MSHITLSVDTGPTFQSDVAADELLSLANMLRVNVTTTWNGLRVTARPGMTADDIKRDYELSLRLADYPQS